MMEISKGGIAIELRHRIKTHGRKSVIALRISVCIDVFTYNLRSK